MYYTHIFWFGALIFSLTIPGNNYTGADCKGDAEGMTEAAVISSRRASVTINIETRSVNTNQKLKQADHQLDWMIFKCRRLLVELCGMVRSAIMGLSHDVESKPAF